MDVGKLQKMKNNSKALSKIGEKNPMWKGDQVKMNGLHDWVHRRLPKPSLCNNCKLVQPYDLANISGKYLRDLSDWEYLCRKCHMLSDGRLNNLTLGYKLNEKQVMEIYNFKGKLPRHEVASIYQISESHVKNIWLGHRWSSITLEIAKEAK